MLILKMSVRLQSAVLKETGVRTAMRVMYTESTQKAQTSVRSVMPSAGRNYPILGFPVVAFPASVLIR